MSRVPGGGVLLALLLVAAAVLAGVGRWSGKAPPRMRGYSALITRVPWVSGIAAAVLSIACFSAFLFRLDETKQIELVSADAERRAATAQLIGKLRELREATSEPTAEEKKEDPGAREEEPVAREDEPATREDGSGVAVSEERTRQEMRREAGEIPAALRRLRQAGRQMKGIRRASEAGDLGASARCGDLMREYRGEARELRERADKYSDVLVFRSLSVSCGLMEMCVSCSVDAAEGDFCTVVDENLRDAAKWKKEL